MSAMVPGCFAGSALQHSCTTRTRTGRLSRRRRWLPQITEKGFRLLSNATMCSACNFIRRNPETRDSRSWRIFVLSKRIIACLDVDGGRVVKGVRFLNLRDAGDPAELANAHARAGADEIVLLDITATHEE